MNILAISKLFPNIREKRFGIFVARQLSEMAVLGANITVFVPVVWCPQLLRHFKRWQNYDHSCPLCRVEGLKTVAVPYIRPPGNWYNRWSGLIAFWGIRKKALELHKKRKFDLIYATDFFPDGDAAVRLGEYLNVPTACLGIGVDVNETAHSSKILYRHFVRTARALNGTLACGESVTRGIDAVTGQHSLCVYGVVDLEDFAPVTDNTLIRKELGVPLNKIIALYAGYLQRRKGIYEMLEGFYRIRKLVPDLVLYVCGSGQEESRFKQLVKERSMEDIIRMVGNIEPGQMSKWMKASDLFVLASHTEGMPNVVMEAMACGLPVVTTRVGGLPEAVGDCTGAILVEPKNVEELTQAILKVVSDDSLRDEMKLAARHKAEERFGVQRNAKRILEFLSNIAEKCVP